ncbi:MAG TPA: peroxiredoxin [Acidimicrobiales bacterium]
MGPAVAGAPLPDLALASTAGGRVALRRLGRPRAVVFAYPMTGRPGVPLPAGWEEIPGAVGCTAEACGFRDRHAALAGAGVEVYGLSTQGEADQQEAVGRLGLPYPLLSDEAAAVADALGLPTFTAGGRRRYERLTLVVRAGVVEHVFHPVPDPAAHAAEVLAWLGGGGS